ncbi:hypothetical protein [Streptomyces sp. CBMA152]|nr:hypothetical protein [Streptomyces sp. CBMA152]
MRLFAGCGWRQYARTERGRYSGYRFRVFRIAGVLFLGGDRCAAGVEVWQ